MRAGGYAERRRDRRDRERVERANAEAVAATARRRLADAERALDHERRERDGLRFYLALIVDGAGGEVTIPARTLAAAPSLPALAVRRDLDGNVTLSTR